MDYKIPLVLSDDAGIRLAGKLDECFYCGRKVGQPHKLACVILQKKIKVKYTFELDIEVPYDSQKDMIEFHRNEGIWCANNAIQELQEYKKQLDKEGKCLCQGHKFSMEVIEIPKAPPYRKNKNGEIVD